MTLQLNGTFYPNNSIIAPADFGVFPFGLLCLTNYSSCCRSEDTVGTTGQGQWYYPNGTEVKFPLRSPSFYMIRRKSMLALNRKISDSTQRGVYHCQIPIDSQHSKNVYVGIYSPQSGMLFDINRLTIVTISIEQIHSLTIIISVDLYGADANSIVSIMVYM